MMYRKFGYGRGAAQISVEVRAGRMHRDQALEWVREHDGVFPKSYANVPVEEVLYRISMKRRELDVIMDKFTNKDLFAGAEHFSRPILKEFACSQPA